jgi:class 3 adenylate cyclase
MDVSDASGASPFALERKLVAVLVCEIDAPIASSVEHELDEDEHEQRVDGLLRRVQAEVARHGGMVAEVMGETVLAVFGVPRTREDTERAVRSALAIQVALPGAGVDGAGQLRAGVSFGEAVVRHGRPASGLQPEVTGEVVSAAAALKDAASPGMVLVNAATLRVTERAISYGPARLLA